ncbi:putative sugar isomerase SgbE [Clostridia bacterium]|nr:putative sugar isomerase SgbE [Clostridia bacterium]
MDKIEQLRLDVYEANMLLPKYKLVTFTWGNVSAIDRDNSLVAIKPSGVEYSHMKPSDIVVISLETGEIVAGDLKPSSDTPTHLQLYKSFPNIGGIVHTHSRWATIYAQAKRGIPPFGTTHGDYFFGEIPCTRLMTAEEIGEDYEKNTGKVIAEAFADKSPDDIPAVLAASHGPFTWGTDAKNAAHNAVVLEELAFMAWHNQSADPALSPMQTELLNKHYLRKHGATAYYGQ